MKMFSEAFWAIELLVVGPNDIEVFFRENDVSINLQFNFVMIFNVPKNFQKPLVPLLYYEDC